METQILDKDAAVLREVAKEVPLEGISSKKIQSVLERMKKALATQDDGVAIAAPQIGESLRIFVVSGRTLTLLNQKKKPARTGAHSGGKPDEEIAYEDQIYINPVITKLSRRKKKMEEGCLSVRWLYGQVERSEKATVRAFDENGALFEKGGSGLMAQIFQHEVDHLNGILFIDKAENIEDLPPETHGEH